MADTDVIVVGAGLAGLVAASEVVAHGKRVIVLDQEGEQSLGGQAFWSLGGLFMVNSPEQRRMGIRDNRDLAWRDWLCTAQFSGAQDDLPRQMAERFVDFASGEMRDWLYGLGMRWFPIVGWAERGGGKADDRGNSVPRFHVTWGVGGGVLAPFIRLCRTAEAEGRLSFAFRHRVTALTVEAGRVTGVSGEVLASDKTVRGSPSSRKVQRNFSFRADAVIVASGGLGANQARVRELWPVDRLGPAPQKMLSGVPDYVDGKLQEIARDAGAVVINEDRMWHYCEGITNYDPIWPSHGIRILPGPSSIWLDGAGNRMQAPYLPGFDTLGTLRRIRSAGFDHSWFILTQKIIEKEFALSGSEQNPDLESGRWAEVLRGRLFSKGAPAQVEAFKQRGEDFVVADDLEQLVAGMNLLTPDAPVDPTLIHAQIEARDAELNNKFGKDAQIAAIRSARGYLGDRLLRTAKLHRILDPKAGPLIAVRLNILTRKTLGGLATDLDGRVLARDGGVFEGLYAAGEVAGFGAGGYHGHAALEGTFLGGCIFSGRAAGRAAAQ